MSKNILILSASPRKGGNSDMLCDQFLTGAEEAGHTVEKIHVQDQKIGFCLACEHCQENGGVCVQKDGMKAVLDKMIRADVIVMATPVYFYTMSAQMKALIDRTVLRYKEIRDKDFYVIISAADTDEAMMERTVEGFRGFFNCLDGAHERGVVYGVGAWKKGDIVGSPSMARAYELGKGV